MRITREQLEELVRGLLEFFPATEPEPFTIEEERELERLEPIVTRYLRYMFLGEV